MPEPKVRLADIAKNTGYSLATVSKALNGRSDISAEARTAIDRALKASGYQRRGQKTAGQRYIEVVFQDLDTIWALEVLRGVLRETRHSPDISVITTESGTRQHPEDDWITGMLRRRPFGVIFIFANLTEKEKTKLQANGIPYVIFDPSGEPSNDDFSVQADNWAGGVLATRHLLALGHTRIGIITGPEEMMCSRARFDGYTSALAEQGIALDPELVTEGDFTTEGGYAQAMALLENPNRPTAIFAGSDLQAMGVYEAARLAVETVDECVSQVVEATQKMGGITLITADHGNADRMLEPDGVTPYTAHTTNLVPFYIVGADVKLRDGKLCDIAPTMLDLMGLQKPREMTGDTLIQS